MATVNRALVGVTASERIAVRGAVPSPTRKGGVGGFPGVALAGTGLTSALLAVAALTLGGYPGAVLTGSGFTRSLISAAVLTLGKTPGAVLAGSGSSTSVASAAALSVSSGISDDNASYRYVNPARGSNGNGLSWSTAFNAIPATPQRGLTYWLADGTYPSRTFGTAPSSTTRITIKKATPQSHGTATGWTDSLGDGQAVFSGGLAFTTANWTLDGNSGGGWATSGYGIRINHPDGPGVQMEGANVIVARCEIVGNGGDGAGSYPWNDAFQWRDTDNGSNCTVSHCYTHDQGRCVFFCQHSITGVVVEYCRTGLYESNEDEHSEVASIWGGASGWTFRHNLFTYITGSGGLLFDGDDWLIHGNVFYRAAGDTWAVGNGAIGSWTTPTEVLNGCKVYNNTFINVTGNGGGPLVPGGILIGGGVGNEARNNIFMGGAAPDFTWFAHSHNHFVNVSGVSSESGTGSSSAVNPFVDYLNFDFRLTEAGAASMTAGTTLAAPYNTDFDGNTRGADGKWDKGAFERV
jgi:hypothetical protein